MKHFCSFSEAIRAGVPMLPQAYFTYWDNRRIAACAIGTGAIAIHEYVPAMRCIDSLVDGALGLYPYMTAERRDLRCPRGSKDACAPQPSLKHTVAHLNDFHQWGREAIADWLEREEEKLGFVTVTVIESEPVRADLSFDQQPESARAGVLK